MLENDHARVPKPSASLPRPLFVTDIAAFPSRESQFQVAYQEIMASTVEKVQVPSSAPAEVEQASADANIVELPVPEGWSKKSLATIPVRSEGAREVFQEVTAQNVFS